MSLGRAFGYVFRKNVPFAGQTYPATFSLKRYKYISSFPVQTYPAISLLKDCKSTCSDFSHVSSRKKYTNFFASLDPANALRIEKLKDAYEKICYDLTKEKNTIVSKTISDRLGTVLQYNVVGGKMIRAQLVIIAFTTLCSKENIDKDLDSILILSWCVEMLQAFFIISDDLMDNGSMRRGKPCWFRLPEVGMHAINDALLLECTIFQMIKHYLSHKECYTKIVDEFLTITRATVWGQCLDMEANSMNKPKLELFNYPYYYNIIEHKTAYYTFCLPVFLAMHVIGGFGERDFENVKTICMKMGRLFQIQDDYLDLYGDSIETGKIGTDIQEGKCTWFAVTALENSSDTGKKIMEENYGVKDQSAAEKVLQLYDSLSLKEKYVSAEQQLSSEISCLIQELTAKKTMSTDIFCAMLSLIDGRNK